MTTTSRRWYFDIETNGLLDSVTELHSLVLQDMDTGEMISCCKADGYTSFDEGVKLLADASELCGHNIIRYDIPVLKKLVPGWTHSAKVTDTFLLTQLLFPTIREKDAAVRARQMQVGKEASLPGNLVGSHGLEAWGYRLGLMKGDYSKECKAQGIDPWSRWRQAMQDYCEQDVVVTAGLHQMIAKAHDLEGEWAQCIEIETRFAELMFMQEQHGFRFDVTAAEKLEAAIRSRRAELDSSLSSLFAPWWAPTTVHTPKRTARSWVEDSRGAQTRNAKRYTGDTYLHKQKNGKTVERRVSVTTQETGYYNVAVEGEPYTKVELRTFNPASRAHIANRLTKVYGWQPTEFTETQQPKIDDTILGDLPYPPAQTLAEVMMLDKRLGQLSDGSQAWLRHAKDGRIHGRVKTLGTITGRCSHTHPNVAQVPSVENAKGPVPYGAECRSLFLPDEGHVLVGCDASGLELRCLAHYMSDGGRYADIILNGDKAQGTDIHSQNQKAAGLPSRTTAKTFIYGFLYGAGDAKVGDIVGKDAAAGKKLKDKFLKNTPGLASLIKAVKSAARRQGWVRGIDGRRVTIRAQHAALNTLLQSAGAIAMKLATIITYDKATAAGLEWGTDWALVANVHDEMQMTCRPDRAEELAALAKSAITEAGDRLGFTCRLDGEAEIGTSWKETH